MVCDHEIVSLCYTSFTADIISKIGIGTLNEHRARKVAHAYLQECKGRGLVPYWDCTDANYPSDAVALNIGPNLTFNYSVYGVGFNVWSSAMACF
nr:GNAT family N-acetyltransferase [Pseudalkalibacillus decolorationis]